MTRARTLLGGIAAATRLDRALAARRRAAGAPWDDLALALIAIVTILVLLTYRDYGVTWDENVHNLYGQYVLNYYLSFFSDRRCIHWLDLYNYGAAFDMTAAALNRFSTLGLYETRHLLNGCVGIVGLIGCWKLGRALGGPRTGCIALLFLAAVPNYYGQMFNNPKDIPFAVGSVWAIYYLVRIIPSLPRPGLALLVKLAVAIGLTLGVRVGGLLLLCYLGLLLAVDGAWQALAARSTTVLIERGWTSLWRVMLPVALVAYAIMLVFWPWAQRDPIHNPLQALANFSHEVYPFSTLFDGVHVRAEDLPPTYLPTYIALALPELILVLLIAAPILAGIALRRRLAWRREVVLPRLLIGFAIVFPVAYAIAIKAVLFDGMRHFIFILPLIAAAAALAADRLLDRLARAPYRWPIYAALSLYGMAHLSIMVMLHPDQYVYYNAFVGGVEGAQRQFKLDYWANSYAEAVHGLEHYLRAQYGADFSRRKFTVAVCGPPVSAEYFFPPNFRYKLPRQDADFFIAFTKDNCDRALLGHPVYQVRRMGALLSIVLDRREILAAATRARQPLLHEAVPSSGNWALQ